MSRYPANSTPLLTEDLIRQISDVIRQGAYVETAVAFCGISKDSFYRWLRLAQSENPPPFTKELSYAIEKALGEAELRDLAVIDRAAQQGVWQAAAWRLERRSPQRWGRQAKVQLEHSLPNEKPAEEPRLTKEELKARVLQLRMMNDLSDDE